MKKTEITLFLVLALFLTTTTVAASANASIADEIPSQDPSKAKISPELQQKFRTKANTLSTQNTEKIQVMISLENYNGTPSIPQMKETSSKSQKGLQNLADKNPKIQIKNRFWIANAVLLEVDPTFPIENIAGVKGVRQLNTNTKVSTLQNTPNISTSSKVSAQASTSTYGLNQINTTETWNEFSTKGENAKIAVLDTGVDPDHPDIDIQNKNWKDFVYSNNTAVDHQYHGTHVSGTVVGEDSSGANIGVAPDATLMHGAVLGENGRGDFSNVIDGIQWAVDNNADVVSMSLGGQTYYDPFIDPIRNAERSGTAVISAAGNNGEDTSDSPGNVYDGLAIGASAENQSIADLSSGDEIFKSYWNNPPAEWPNSYIIPDISAPGINVYSGVPVSYCNGDPCYSRLSGTSMATPHVSGAAALMESATSVDLTPAQMRESLVQTAWKPADWSESFASASIEGQDTRYGHGIIDAYAATEYAINNFDEPASLKISNQTVEAGTEAKITVRVQNSAGKTIKDDRFAINAANKDNLNLSNLENTNSSGVANFTLNETTASSYRPEFELDSDPAISKSIGVEVKPSDPYNLTSTDKNVTANQKDHISLTLTDAFGNNIQGEDINLRDAGGLNISDATATTDPKGVASFSFRNKNAGNYISVFEHSSDNNITANVSVTVNPAEPVKITFVKNSSTVAAGNKTQFVVQLRDSYENPTTNHTGFNNTINIETGLIEPGKVNISAKESEKSFNWSNNKTGRYNISTNTTLNDTKHTITVNPGNINASQTNVSANKNNITADGSSTTEITVNAKDKYGNSLEKGGENIILNTTAGTLLDTVKDKGNGNYTQLLESSTNLETAEINASIDNQEITDNASVNFVAGSPAIINVSKSGTATADNQDKLEVTLKIEDSNANPVKNTDINSSTSAKLNISESNKTDENGEAFFNFTTTKAGTYKAEFTAENLSQKTDLIFKPGKPQKINFNTVKNQTIGEPFNITLSAVDEYDNIATNYSNKTNLSSQADITPSQTANFTEGQLENWTVTLDYNETIQNIQINASDNIAGKSNSFNLTKPKPPKIEVLDVNASLLLQNETVGIKINDTAYSYNNDIERSLNISDQKLVLENAQKYDFKANYTSNEIKDYTLNFTVADVFNQTASKAKNISFRDPSQFSANISGSNPEWRFKDPGGNTRTQNNTSKINSTLPSDDNWTLEMGAKNQSILFKTVNVTKDVNESFNLQTDLKPEIKDVKNTKALALNTSMNYSAAEISVNTGADRAQKCSEWNFQKQECDREWENITNQASFSSSQASITVSSFSAYAFSESAEEEEDDESSGDEESSSGGGGGGGGYSLPPSDNITENETEENINQTLEENQTTPEKSTENQTKCAKNVAAVNPEQTKCETFNECEVPSDWRKTDQCRDWEKERAQKIIENLSRRESTSENKEKLERIQKEYDKGNYSGAIELGSASQNQQQQEERITDNSTLFSYIVVPSLVLLAIMFVFYRRMKRDSLVSKVEQLKEEIEQGDMDLDSEKILEASKAIKEEDYSRARKTIEQIEDKNSV